MSMDLNDLLRVLGQAASTQPSSRSGGSGDPLKDILGELLGGGTPQSGNRQSRAGNDPVLGSIGQGRVSQPSADSGMADILGSLLGGGNAPQQSMGGSSTGMGDLLGGLLGGGTTRSGTSGNPFIAPLVELVVNKTGLPPAIAEMAVTFAVAQILSSLTGKAQGSRQVGLEFNNLARQLSTGDGVDHDFLSSTGLAQQFAEQSGLDLATATNALEQTYGLISPAMAGEGLPAVDKVKPASSSKAKSPAPTKSSRPKSKRKPR